VTQKKFNHASRKHSTPPPAAVIDALPDISGLDAAGAESALTKAGWTHLKHTGDRARVLFSPDGGYVARLAKGDAGFEAFAAFCATAHSPHLPKFHHNSLSDTGVHLTIAERLKRYPEEKNPEIGRQARVIRDYLRNPDGAQPTPAVKAVLLQLIDAAMKAHEADPRVHAGIDFAGDKLKNFLYRETRGGGVQIVLTDAFAGSGLPVEPDWQKLRRKLAEPAPAGPAAKTHRRSALT
jgi:hypothetical protein